MNNRYNCWGIYAPYIKQMLDLKIACGHKCRNDAYFLQQFDRYTIDKNETVIGITKELVDEWCNGDKNIKDSIRYCRYLYLSQLSVHLNKIGIQSYVPQHSYKQPAHTPYVFSKEEIDKIFKEVDCLRTPNKNTFSVIFVMPVLLRLLYSTGLRIGEALSLKNKDINLVDNYIHTKDSKNGEERIIPMSNSLSAVCKGYVSHKKNIPIIQYEDSPFFPNLQGEYCKRYTIMWNFRNVLTKAKIPYANNGHPPRIHDSPSYFCLSFISIHDRIRYGYLHNIANTVSLSWT